MRKSLFIKYFIIIFLKALILTPKTCLAENPKGVIGHVAKHIDTSLIVQKDRVQDEHLYYEKITTWTGYEIVSDTAIRVYFRVGDKRCHGHRAVLQETDDAIDIIVIAGAPYDDKGKGYECRPIWGMASFLLHTQSSIGNRQITQKGAPFRVGTVPKPYPPDKGQAHRGGNR